MAIYQTTAVPLLAKAWFLLVVLVVAFFIIVTFVLTGKYTPADSHFKILPELSPRTFLHEKVEAMIKQQTTELRRSTAVDQVQKDNDMLRVNKTIVPIKTASSTQQGNHFSSIASEINLCAHIPERHLPMRTNWNITTVKYFPENSDKIVKRTLSDLNVEKKNRFCSILNQTEDSLGIEYTKLPQRERYAISVDILARLGYEQRLPNVIGLGVKKTGSTALLHFMKFHPQIRAVSQEVHFFNRDKEYTKGINYYRTKMEFSKEDDIVYEKSPGYFNESSVVPARIKTSLPSTVKFILGVRDPIERTISDFHHTSFIHGVAGTSLNECTPISEGKRFVKTLFDKNDNVRVNHTFIDASNYAHHFKSWLEYFPHEQFFIFDEKEMKNDSLKVIKKLEEFLGIDSFFTSDMISVRNGKSCFHTQRAIYCPPTWGHNFPKPKVDKTYLDKLQNYFLPLNKEFEFLVNQHFDWGRSHST